MNEQKIREAFEKYFLTTCATAHDFTAFRAGYLALLNELEPQGEWSTFQKGLDIELRRTTIYTFPEGVEKP